MQLTLDTDQVRILREIVHGARSQLVFEIARSDNKAFQRQLREREHVVEALEAKLSTELE